MVLRTLLHRKATADAWSIGRATLHAALLTPLAVTPGRAAPLPLTYGVVHFDNSCAPASQAALEAEIAKLHSFEADPATFAAIGERDKRCAIAWWGAAMSARGNPVGDTPDAKTLAQGRAYLKHATAVRTTSRRETMLIEAMDVFYRPYKDEIARARAYSETMDAARAAYPDDPDIAAFDGLAIIEGVDLDDKTFARQKRAGAILEGVMKTHPENPGTPHYLIHAYDYTALAPQAVHAAEVYPTIATASSHAQHMPSHIWSMLGDWDKSIAANRQSSFIADPKSHHDRVKGDIVFDHAFDFIAYARLQKGEDKHVADDIAAAASPPIVVRARYALERGDWAAAQAVPARDGDPFDGLLARFTRAYGAARAGDLDVARRELGALKALRPSVESDLGAYWAAYVDIYADAAAAWIALEEHKTDEAMALMTRAADRDDGHEKHIYLENKLLPMREALADMESAAGRPQAALADFERSLALAPNRYRSFAGAAQAADAAGDVAAARAWWVKLVALAQAGDRDRPGDGQAKAYLAAHSG